MKKHIIKIISAAINAVLILSVVLVGVVVVNLTNKKVPQIFGYSILHLVSNSMYPDYQTDDYILVKKISPDELVVGDVISFYSNDPAIYKIPNTHQIVEIKKNENISFVTKGKANNINDQYEVLPDDIIGKVICKVGVLSLLTPLLKRPLLFIAIILIPLGIMAFIEIYTRKKEKE